MRAFRLCRARHAEHALDGEGAQRYGGRWNPVGTPVVYCAASLSLAALEALTDFASGDAPPDYVSIEVQIPDDLDIERFAASDLPRHWQTYPAPEALAELGRAWVASGRTAVLAVPSAVISSEWNFVLNPAHAEFAGITTSKPTPFRFAPRLL